MTSDFSDAASGPASSEFQQQIKDRHRSILKRYNQFRQTISGVLLLNPDEGNEQYTREELIKRNSQIREHVRTHIETIQSVMLPALSKPDEHVGTEVDVLATVQKRLRELLNATNEHFNGLLDETSSPGDRQNVARKVLLDIFRLDSVLKVYLEIVENHYAPLADQQLDVDEKEEILTDLADSVR